MSEQDNGQLRRIVEAAIFAAEDPVTIDKVLSLFPDDARPTRDEVRAVLDALQSEYDDRGIILVRIDGAYRFQTRDELAPWVQKLWATRPPRYSRALLETLAIIAYRQPITRGEIEEIRGVAVSTDIMKTLLGREWVKQVGYRDVPGRPALFASTRGFLEHFNLKALSELPSLAELRDTDVIARELNLSLDLRMPAEEGREGSVEDAGDVDGGEDAADDPSAPGKPFTAKVE